MQFRIVSAVNQQICTYFYCMVSCRNCQAASDDPAIGKVKNAFGIVHPICESCFNSGKPPMTHEHPCEQKEINSAILFICYLNLNTVLCLIFKHLCNKKRVF